MASMTELPWRTGGNLGLLLHAACLCVAAISLAGGNCSVDQTDRCRHAVRGKTLDSLLSGGTCMRKQYFVYTHVCTINAHARAHDTDHCCCAHDDRVFCCKYHQAGNVYRCDESGDVIDVVVHSFVVNWWEVVLPVVLGSALIIACMIYCYCKRRCCKDELDSVTETECGCCTQSDSEDGRGKDACQLDKDNEMPSFHCGDKLLPVTDLGHCDYPPYPGLHQFAPCPHCGLPPTVAVHPATGVVHHPSSGAVLLSVGPVHHPSSGAVLLSVGPVHPSAGAVHPSAPPAEDDESCSDQTFVVHPETTGPMPPRTYSDAATFMCSDRDPAYFARSNSVPAAMPPRLMRSYTCPSCPSAAIAPPSYDDSHHDRIVS